MSASPTSTSLARYFPDGRGGQNVYLIHHGTRLIAHTTTPEAADAVLRLYTREEKP